MLIGKFFLAPGEAQLFGWGRGAVCLFLEVRGCLILGGGEESVILTLSDRGFGAPLRGAAAGRWGADGRPRTTPQRRIELHGVCILGMISFEAPTNEAVIGAYRLNV